MAAMFPDEGRESPRHRARNLLALVQALAEASRPGESLEDYRSRLGRRLAALARAESLLPEREGEEAPSVGRLVRGELANWGLGEDSLVALAGPLAPIRPQAVRMLALALHELAANAAEHGALARDGGGLAISWERKGGDVVIEWRETCASASPDAPRGFGRELIEEGLPHQLGATVDYRLGPEGLICRIVAQIAAD